MTQSQQLNVVVDASVELARAELSKLTGQLDKAARRSERTQRQVEKSFKGMDKAAALAKTAIAGFVAAFSVNAIISFGRSILQFSDDLATAADQAGLGIERYQTLTEALRVLEISGESTAKIFVRLQDAIGRTLTGSASKELTDALDRLGLSQRILSGEVATTEQAFDILSAAAERYSTKAEFAADIAAVVGRRNGTELAAALKVGAAGLKALEDQVRATGNVIDADLAARFADANEVIDQFFSSGKRGAVIWAGEIIKQADDVALVYKALSDVFTSLGGSIEVSFGGMTDFIERDFDNVTRIVRSQLQEIDAISGAVANNPIGRRLGLEGSTLTQDFDGALRARQAEAAIAGTGIDLLAPLSESGVDRGGPGAAPSSTRPPPRSGGGGAVSGRAGAAAPTINDPRTGGFGSIDDAQAVPLQGSLLAAIELEEITARLEKDFIDLSQVDIINPEAVRRAEEFGQNLSRNLAFAVVQGQNIGDALVNSFKAAAAEALASGLLSILTGGGGGGGGAGAGFLGSVFGGFFADGGRPPMGRVSVVGERGPELFVPDSAGTIIPNGGFGGATTIINDLRGAIVQEDLYRRIEDGNRRAAMAGAQGGAQMAAAQSARTRRRSL